MTRKLGLMFLLFCASIVPAAADADPAEPVDASADLLGPVQAPAPRRSNTNITVDSSELNPFIVNEEDRRKKEDRLVFYRDEAVNVDINDDGDPNLNMQF